LRKAIINQTKNCSVIPVYVGSALKKVGVTNLMDGISKIFSGEDFKEEKNFSAVIYKINIDENKDKKIYFKVYGGSIKIRDTIFVDGKKILIRNLEGLSDGKIVRVESISQNDIGILTNVKELKVGQILGEKNKRIKDIPKSKAIIKSNVKPVNQADRMKLIYALKDLSIEDPDLKFEINANTSEISLELFGEIEKEFIGGKLFESYGIDTEFTNTKTIYKETILNSTKAYIKMNEKDNIYRASIGLLLEPLARGRGIQYESKISYGYLHNSFQTAVYDGVMKGLKEGINGLEVTDIKVTFIYAYYDSVTSTPADFRSLAPVVIKKTLQNLSLNILKPVIMFKIFIPSKVCGKVIRYIENMEGQINSIEELGNKIELCGKVPLETSKDYAVKLLTFIEDDGKFIIEDTEYL
ncbi:MAG: hypothetical protein PUE01_09430, partial [Clostridiaceae bacterium]|nr:hypothetical protein [Clostridiaceae bacterium]